MITTSDFPKYRGKMEYVCLGCQARFDIHELYYTCPHCGGVFLLEDTTFDSLLEFPASYWQSLFDKRASSRVTALRGVLRFYELMAPVMEEQDIVYLGEGHTPLVAANEALTEQVGGRFDTLIADEGGADGGLHPAAQPDLAGRVRSAARR